ncbi:U3 small nucleolar ribonucleoprotein protein MPP10-like [Asterias amurensis]|uniref:U3 small nucleolar ribonucleoprotein protein MPP10-like n=1 Tax=Asterias amurensis TaxID=7602 RepID=UPI003AB184FF
MDSSELSDVLQEFKSKTKSPENFITAQPSLVSSFNHCTKRLFDLSHHCQYKQKAVSSNTLTKLTTEGLDAEQIWGQIQLTNGPILKYITHDIAKALIKQHDVTLLRTQNQPSEEDDNGDKNEQEYDGSQDLFEDAGEKGKVLQDSDDSSDQDSELDFDIAKLETQSKKKTTQRSGSQTQRKGFQGRTSVVDDTFFKLSEMEKFLEMEDAKEERRRRKEDAGVGDVGDEEEEEENSDVESIDLFDEFPSSDEDMEESDNDEETEGIEQGKSAKNLVYDDFFGSGGDNAEKQRKPPKKKSVHFEESDFEDELDEEEEDLSEWRDKSDEEEDKEDEEEDEEGDEDSEDGEDASDILGGKPTEGMSTFEKRQEKLKQKIEQLEEANMVTKPWQLSGEVRSSKRPENSLLAESLDFEVTSKPAPVITEETTQALEDIIRQRILDHAWDDVERKQRRKEEAYEFKKRITLDQEKSKLSLAEIYEKEYLKQSEQNKEEEENPAHVEIKKMMESLFVKLDALTNFHFMPKPILAEVKIVPNVASITMEEVAPITATDASLLAPEEIQEKPKVELKGDSEKTSTDKKQALRKKKKTQRVRARDQEKKQRAVEKLRPGLGNKYSMKGALKKLEQDSKMPSSKTTFIKSKSGAEKSLTSSKTFFGRLQDEVSSELKGVKKKRKTPQQTLSSKKLKL